MAGIYCVDTKQFWPKARLAPPAARGAESDGRTYVKTDLPAGVTSIRDCTWTGTKLRKLTAAELTARDAADARALAEKKLAAPIPTDVLLAFMEDAYNGQNAPALVANELARRQALRTAAGK